MIRWQWSIPVVISAALVLAAGAQAHTVRSGSVTMDSSEIHPGQINPSGSNQSLVELLLNPGFESGSLPPWTTDANWTVVGTNPHSGSFCATDDGNHWIRQDFPGINTANVLSVSFWARQPIAQIQAFDFIYSDNSFDEDIWFPATTWGQKDITYLLRPAGATLIAIRIWGYVSSDPEPDITFVDDVTINVAGATPVAPSTWGLIKSQFTD